METPVSKLRFGVESEFFLEAHDLQDGRAPNARAFAETLVAFYNADIRTGHVPLRLDSSLGSHPGHFPASFKSWSVVHDDSVRTLPGDPVKMKGFSLEMVSPIFDFCAGSSWRKQISHHWKIVERFGTVHVNDTCATHVHISPQKGTPWTLDQVKRVAQAILYFEDAFEAVLPPNYRGHCGKKSNRVDNVTLRELKPVECFGPIQACDNISDLILLMQPLDPLRRRYSGLHGEQTDREYGWNFENLEPDEIGTIEFRRGPGVLTAAHCIVWVEFAVSFVQAAMQYGTKTELTRHSPDARGLKQFILQAAAVSERGMNNREILETAFLAYSGPGARAPIPIPPTSGATWFGKKDPEEEARRQNVLTDRMKEISL